MEEKKKKIHPTGTVVIVIILGAVLAIAYWLISPLFFDKYSDESIEDIASEHDSVKILQEGSFVGVVGHEGGGTAQVLDIEGKNFVRFDDDFFVTNGPDLLVYLGRGNEYDPKARLGKLKGSKGAQNYAVPSGIKLKDYNSVWVFCRAFKVPFSHAQLRDL